MKRRLALILPFVAAGCSVLPDRPFIDARRFVLEPRREGPAATRPARAGALLMRSMRAAPGLEQRGLRRLRPDGVMEMAPYEEWLAPPADLAELALRQWLIASGRFTAVTAPGSRLGTSLILETELLTLHTEGHQAKAAMTALLLTQGAGLGDPRPRGQIRLEATSPVSASSDGVISGEAASRAAAMQAALGLLFGQVENWTSSQ